MIVPAQDRRRDENAVFVCNPLYRHEAHVADEVVTLEILSRQQQGLLDEMRAIRTELAIFERSVCKPMTRIGGSIGT